MLCVKERIKMASLHSSIHPSIHLSTCPKRAGFSETNANQNSHGGFPSTKIIKLSVIMCNKKSSWRSSH